MPVFTQTILEEKLANIAAGALHHDEPGLASMIYILLETMGYSQEMAIITMMSLYNTDILRPARMTELRHRNREITDRQYILLKDLSKLQNDCLDNRFAQIAIAIAIIIQTFQSNQDKELLDMMNIYNQDTLKPLRTEATTAERENWRVNP